METKRVQSLIIRVNNKNTIIVEQNKYRQKLDELRIKFHNDVIKKLKMLKRSNENVYK